MDYRVLYLDLPCCIKGMTALDENGFYNIYINARLGYKEQQKTIRHELTHITRQDFYRPENRLELIEKV